jgi:hypothetical protein
MIQKSQSSKSGFSWHFSHIVVWSLVVFAALILAWVGWLIWFDMTEWGKDLSVILFSSRANEQIGLGIGMTVIHYFLIGMSMFALGLVLLLRIRIRTKKPQHALHMKNGQKGTSGAKSLVKNENHTSEEDHFSGCSHYFGYLSSRSAESAIPQECMLCHRLGDCMVATLYVKKINK